MSEQRRRGPMGGHGRMMSGEKAKDFKGSMAKLFRYMGRYKFRFILMFIFAVAGTVFSIVGPKILGKATTELFNGLVAKVNGTGGINFGKIGMILLWTLGLYLASACFSFIQGWIMTGISNDVTYNLRKDISKKINKLPLNYFESRTNGEILSRITNDVDTLQMSLNQSLTQLITSVTTLIGVFIMMLSINVWMTLAALLILPVSMFIIQTVMKHSQKYFQDQQSYLGKVNGQIEENFGGHNVVRVFNKENDVVEEFEKDNQKLYESAWKSQFFSGMMMPIMQFVGNLGYVMVALLGGVFVIKKSIEVGDIQSFFQYIRNFTQPIQQIAQVTNLLQSSAAASERVFEFLEEPEESQNEKNPVDVNTLTGDVQFEHVKFGYNPDKIIISPGPGRPSDAGICEEAISYFAGKVPILGVCLGHQAICETYGATITYAKKLMHGKMSVANVDINCKLFKGLQKRIEVARYHSLAASEENFPDVLTVIARTDDDEIMAVKHKDYEIYGVQFHPESILTPKGTIILRNFLEA